MKGAIEYARRVSQAKDCRRQLLLAHPIDLSSFGERHLFLERRIE